MQGLQGFQINAQGQLVATGQVQQNMGSFTITPQGIAIPQTGQQQQAQATQQTSPSTTYTATVQNMQGMQVALQQPSHNQQLQLIGMFAILY